jgi:RNA polymerase sigma-70 factor (ECF subfamily)
MDDLTRLALAAGEGDEEALAAFVRRSQGEVWRLVAALVGRADADDVTQDTYVRAWRALPAFRADASARTWLLVIARRACLDWVRGRVRSRRLADRLELEASSTVTDVPDGVAVGALHQLVEQLPLERREAFVLTQLLGCSYEEAAEVCGVPVGTIRSRVARARAELVTAVHAAEAAR